MNNSDVQELLDGRQKSQLESYTRAINTAKEMVCQRGYVNFVVIDGYIIANNENAKIAIVTEHVQKFDLGIAKRYICAMTALAIEKCIIIYTATVTSYSQKLIDATKDGSGTSPILEIFHEDELQINITKHCLVPKHEKLTKAELLIFNKKSSGKWPILSLNDPISRFYSYQEKDVIRITREMPYGLCIMYRVVCKI